MTKTEAKQKVTYTQDGPKYLFLRDHGVRSDIVLEMLCEDCGHPWWVAEAINEGLDPTFAAYIERLQTKANWACLVLESWELKLRSMHDRQGGLGGYAPASGIDAAQQLRAAINDKPTARGPDGG